MFQHPIKETKHEEHLKKIRIYGYAKRVAGQSRHTKAKMNTKEQRQARMKRIICPQASTHTLNRAQKKKKTLFCFKDCDTIMVLDQHDSEQREE